MREDLASGAYQQAAREAVAGDHDLFSAERSDSHACRVDDALLLTNSAEQEGVPQALLIITAEGGRNRR